MGRRTRLKFTQVSAWCRLFLGEITWQRMQVSEMKSAKGAGGPRPPIAIHQSFYGDAISSLIKSFCLTLYLLSCQLKKSGSVLKSASFQNGIFFLMNFQHFLIYLPKIIVTSEVERYHFFAFFSKIFKVTGGKTGIFT